MHRINLSEENLKRVFEEGFSVRDIASSVASFDSETPAADAREIMAERGWKVAGVRKQGLTAGYVEAERLSSGTCGDHLQPFDDDLTLPDTASLSSTILALDKAERVFVRVLGEVGGLVTRSDLQKPPVRMWLFGVISILEMAVVRIISDRFPDDEWKAYLSENRLNKTVELMNERQRRGQGVGLVDCLQLSDKGWILWKDPELRKDLDVKSRRDWEDRVKTLESLRNNLAHSQDIVTHDWAAIVRLTTNLDKTHKRIAKLHEEGKNRSRK